MEWISQDIDKPTQCTKPGVYRIKLFQMGRPVRIKRFGGVDRDGILAIGYSKNIEERRKQFLRASKGHDHHSEGIQWYLVKRVSVLKDDQYSLKFEFREAESVEEAKKAESEEIWSYFKKFWEPPPLNAAISERKKRFK